MLLNEIKALRRIVKTEIGCHSKREFREAYTYALHKHRNNPRIKEDWCLATVIAETIRQNRLSLYLFQRYAVIWGG